ncbi:zinc finger protein 624 [Photinus pyralis]|nr:zinc finger protein 624 [Photinus pyralis]
MISDYEDDTHYCLKCHCTIIGLDNYVSHRKSKCGKDIEKISQQSGLTEHLLHSDEPVTLKADAFFSSLELQSSAKKTSPASGGKSTAGVLTRSKASAVIQASSSGKDNVNYLESTKHDEWLTDHSLIIHQNRAQTAHKSGVKKEETDLNLYADSEEESDECDYDDEDSDYDEEDDDAPPRSFTGGKWKPTSSPIPNSSGDYNYWNVPPPHHTGAKWKPQPSSKFSLQSEHLTGKWKSPASKELFNTPPISFTGSKWTPSKIVKTESLKQKPRKSITYESLQTEPSIGKWFYQPDPECTKGKWKLENDTEELPDDVPSPFYTKGKWKPAQADCISVANQAPSSDTETEMPPFRKSSGTVQYWCGPCNRHLASKIVYERHLKSELHFKRTLQDREFEESPYVSTLLSKTKRAYSATHDIKIREGTRTRRKIYTPCTVCDSKVNSSLIGKHLISHYHCLRSDLNSHEPRQMVLDNIHSVVLQSPFQCGPCKYYFNTHELFLLHWTSEEHNDVVRNTSSFFWCSECKHRAATSDEMYLHLNSDEHREIIAVINRSVPVVIKKLTPINCPTCNEEFLYNFLLRRHCEKEDHSYNVTVSDEYQSRFKCGECEAVLKSRVAYQRHRMIAHRTKFYICSGCALNFNDIEEAKRHRGTPEHRCAVAEKKRREGLLAKDLSKSCHYCTERFENIIKLKDHLRDKHAEHNHSCPYCGKVFTIPQDLTVHVRTKACTFDENESKTNACDQCQYTTDSTSEFLFHKVLHTEPLYVYADEQESAAIGKRQIPQYKCPICEKFYVKSSLRCHIRIHTKERPFVCALCNAGFVRKNNWVLHMKNHDKSSIRKLESSNQTAELGERPFLCSTCGASFKKRSILQQHMTRHTGKSIKCHHSGCVFSARFPAELKTHLLTHSDDKPFSCDRCDYRGKTKQQLERHFSMHQDSKKFQCPQCTFSSRLASHLKRHLRLHTGAKPFVCPHCNYCCNNLENLRKHVLLTNKHPGKSIYECKFCQTDSFETNFAKDFKIHLLTEHPDTFVSGKEAATYIAGIYEATNDGTSVQIFNDSDDKERNYQREEALSQFQDSIQPVSSRPTNSNVGSTILLTSVTTQDSSEHKIQEELFPMLIVSKDVVCIENPSEAWNIGGSYDVEESGSLVPFHSVGESLFNEHFQ